jgi:hypothetical protein
MNDQRRFQLDLVALPDGIPTEIRLRRLLKVCLRSFRFRATSVEEVKPAEKAEGQSAGPAPEKGQPG